MDIALEDNHIALLQHRAKNTGDDILFKLPILRGEEAPLQWIDVTVAEFSADVDRVASFLITELKSRGIPPRSVVSVLYSEPRHQDLVYTIALARASYIPQVLPGHLLTHPGIIFALMEKAGSKIILYDPALEHVATNCPYQKMSLKPFETIESYPTINSDSALPAIEDLPSGSNICFMYLTSGSTSGSPKVVPLTQKFVSTSYKTQIGILSDRKQFETRNSFLSCGSICAVPSMIQYLQCLHTGSYIVTPSNLRFSTEELSTMVSVCGLNCMITFGTLLARHIKAAKKDPTVLKLLQGMRSVSYSGAPISITDDDWCFENGILLIDLYAATECGILMASVPGKPARFLQPVAGVSYRFDPLIDTTTGVNNPASIQLLKFVLLADSPQIPQPQLLSADGNFHTSDLFVKQLDGSYLFRCRVDDRIKSNEADFIDTKAIEEKIYDTCSDLMKECIVVGHLRPSPALFIEVNHNNARTMSEDGLKELVLRRLEDFNNRQMKHERITDKRLIFIVDEGSLPRTNKGNLRRKAIEQNFQKELDAAYMSLYGL